MKILIAAAMCLLLACHTSRSLNRIPESQLNLPQPKNGNAEIIYLTFKVTLADSIRDEYLFETISWQQAAGVLKKQFADENISRFNFYCELQDANQKRFEIFTVPNPLNQSYEYSSEEGKLDKALIRKKTAEFTIRFQRSAQTKYLMISIPDGNTLQLKRIFHAKI